MYRNSAITAAVALALFLAVAATAQATWSIVMTDSSTKEVAVGTVTCLTTYDLLNLVPVVVVDKGAAAVQSAGDFDGLRRPIIFDNLKIGTDPEDILTLLAAVEGHEDRQYGIVDTQGRAITFTGTGDSPWAGGVVGTQGTLTYAIQANIMVGDCVVPAAEQAILNRPGDMAEKLMAGMEAARNAGGDGRCSCDGQPTDCGCPPPSFEKAGHIGCMVVARRGNRDELACGASGCARGDYFLKIDVPFQTASDPDPVFQLRALFDEWRASLVNIPDAVHSTARIDLLPDPADCTVSPKLRIALRDWQGDRVTRPIQAVVVQHSAASAGITTIGTVIKNGDGTYTVPLTPGTGVGTDEFIVNVIYEYPHSVILIPTPKLHYLSGDADFDEDVDVADYEAFLPCLAGPGESTAPEGCQAPGFVAADLDGDDDVDLADFDILAASFTGPRFDDCNNNGLPDICDVDCSWPCEECNVAGCGLSADCNTNNVPDECEPDCNANGVPDDCELAATHNCCDTLHGPGCSDDYIESCICALDPYCCTSDWDRICAGYVAATICGYCPGADCNANFKLDECDILLDVSDDCDANGEPDECQIPDIITIQPSDTDVCEEDQAVLMLQAGGENLTYQWNKDGLPLIDGEGISGSNSPALTIDIAHADDEGVYDCKVSDGCLVTYSDPVQLRVLRLGTLTGQPQPLLNVCAGNNAVFSVQMTGSSPIPSYQWYADDTPLINGAKYTGAQSAELRIFNVDAADEAHTYHCLIFNPCESIESDPGLVRIVSPVFETEPQDDCGEIGQTVTLTAFATSPLPVTYQWRRGTTVVGSGDTLTIAGLEPADEGDYRVLAFTISPTCISQSRTAHVQVGDCPYCATPGDADGDGDVDLADLQRFLACFGEDVLANPDCVCANVSGADWRVDLEDWPALESLLTGP